MTDDLMQRLALAERRRQQIADAPILANEMERLARIRPDMMHVEFDEGPQFHGGWGLVFSLLGSGAMWAAMIALFYFIWIATP